MINFNKTQRQLRVLARRIERASGAKKRMLKQDYNRKLRQLGFLVWESCPPMAKRNLWVSGERYSRGTYEFSKHGELTRP